MDKSLNAAHVFNKSAQLYQEKYMDVSLYHDSLNTFCNYIPHKNATILELACGPGNVTKYLLKQQPEFKILGTDVAPNMIALAKANNPNATFKVMDCRTIGSLKEKYNAIMCGFCLPYLSKEEVLQLITDASKIIQDNGVIYISTIEGDYSNSKLEKGSTGDEIYMHYHQAEYVTEALKNNGFNNIDIQRINTPTKENTITTDLILIARK